MAVAAVAAALAVAVVVNAADDMDDVEPTAGVVLDAEAEIVDAVVSGATGYTSSHSNTN